MVRFGWDSGFPAAAAAQVTIAIDQSLAEISDPFVRARDSSLGRLDTPLLIVHIDVGR